MHTVILDTVADSELEASASRRDRVRTGSLIGMPLTASTPDTVIHEKVLGILQAPPYNLQWGAPLAPSIPDAFLIRIRIIPVSAKNFRFALYYTTFQGGQPTIYTIRQGGQEEDYTGNLIPGRRVPIRGSWTGTIGGTTTTLNRLVTARFTRPIRSLILTASYPGTLPNNLPVYGMVRSVNDAVWLGLPRGFWKLTRFDTDYAKFSGYYTTEAIAVTRSEEDWSDTYILEDPLGNYVDVTDADMNTINAHPYGGPAGTTPAPPNYFTENGVVRVCPYPVIPFATIFGFSS